MYEEIQHTGTFKQVSPFFRLYCTSPYNLHSHGISPLCKRENTLEVQDTPHLCTTGEPCEDEGAAGYEEQEEWSLECLQTTHSKYDSQYLSPTPWRNSMNNSRIGICESRPLSMTDFGDSLVECDQAEQDFRKLSMEFIESTEDSQPLTNTKKVQETLHAFSTDTVPKPVQTKETNGRHMDEVSRRLYKVLYGYEVDQIDLDVEDVSVMPKDVIHDSGRSYEPDRGAGLTSEDFSISKPEIATQVLNFGDYDAQIIDSIDQTQIDVNYTFSEVARPTGLMKVSHDSTCEQLLCNDALLSSCPCDVCDVGRSDHDMSQPQSDLSSFEPSNIVYDDASSPQCVTDAAVLMRQNRASSPASQSSENELSALAPDSPVPHFRPLSPLPPTVFMWETDDKTQAVCGQSLPSAHDGTSVLFAPQTEERPLTPMVQNKKPFGRPLSLNSDYSGERSISPLLLTFDTDDRASSPESVVFEASPYFFPSFKHVSVSPDFNERASSHDSVTCMTEFCRLPPDSPIPKFSGVSKIFTFTQCLSTSSETVSSDAESECLPLNLLEDRGTSPDSLASVNAYKPLSPDSPLPKFGHEFAESMMPEITSTSPMSSCSDVEYGFLYPVSPNPDNRALSPVSVTSADETEFGLDVAYNMTPLHEITKSAEEEGSELPTGLVLDTKHNLSLDSVPESDQVFSLPYIEEKTLSLESMPEYRSLSQLSAELNKRGSSPESLTLDECLEDFPMPQ